MVIVALFPPGSVALTETVAMPSACSDTAKDASEPVYLIS